MQYLSKTSESRLLEEIDFAIVKMNRASDAAEIVYYFSVLPGTLNRILNFEYHPTLLLIWHILNNVQIAFQQRIRSIVQGGDSVISVTDELLDRLKQLTARLRSYLANHGDESVYILLEEFAALAYSTTGNGHYLRERKRLKFRDI